MTEMKDLGKELFFFAWLERGTDEDFSLPFASPSVTPSPTSQRGEKWDLNEDRPEGGPAGPKSPGRGDCFSSGTGWPGGWRERGSACFCSWFCSVFPASYPFCALTPGSMATAWQTVFWALRQIMEERPLHQLSSLLLFSPGSCAILPRMTA